MMEIERSESVAIPIEQEEENVESSSPLLPSHFLCPPNLGALLESTTVSLVSGGWKDNKDPSSNQHHNIYDAEGVVQHTIEERPVLEEEGCVNPATLK